ncbi:DUF4190 domain-containing protein [Embleya scabrispora]|uniref:DUF4190 domain-containing protein n=1 Tax=Embleya scabrispora TaxID=159449 RepID=UPI00036752DB|nr:DUF4190 domain-containing protein [Embleya scabrispora]MYS80286.1 DUF4190 domain-containing protein [Streptomyces sp. SID5474]
MGTPSTPSDIESSLSSAGDVAPKPPYNLLAVLAPIVGFFCSFLPVGLALGVVALQRIKHTRERGRWLAWTGIAMNTALIALFVVVLIVTALRDDDKPAREAPVAIPGKGDCFAADDPTAAPPTRLDAVHTVACTRVHTGEIYAVFTLDSQAPTVDAESLNVVATTRCVALAREFIPSSGVAPRPGDVHYLLPDPQQWAAGGHTIACFARDTGLRLTRPSER